MLLDAVSSSPAMTASPDHPFDTTLLDEALRLTEAERLALCEQLWRDYLVLNPDQPKPFFAQFDSFEDYEIWRSKQDRPWLY
jgi:hypothetical protein